MFLMVYGAQQKLYWLDHQNPDHINYNDSVGGKFVSHLCHVYGLAPNYNEHIVPHLANVTDVLFHNIFHRQLNSEY